MRYYHCFCATLCFIAVVSCSQSKSAEIAPTDLQIIEAGSGWYKASTLRGGFQAVFPGKPTATTDAVDSPAGRVDSYAVLVEPSGTVAFGVMYHSSPRAAPATILQTVCSAAIRNAKVVSERAIVLAGVAGREVIMKKLAGQALVTLRVYIFDGRVYYVSVVVPVKEPFKEHTSQFLDSFEILK